MSKRTTGEVIFFALVFVLFYLGAQTGQLWVERRGGSSRLVYIILGLVYTMVLVGVYYLSGLGGNNSENFWEVSDYAQCRGGPYMWQGDSPKAKMCRALASTPQGRCEIASYNCPKGYIGTPRRPFEYTPMSNDNWENEMCREQPPCPCDGNDLCSMHMQ